MYGIEKIKEAIAFALKFGFTIKEALEDDDKISGIAEYFAIAKSAGGIIDVLKNAGQIWKEYVDLDDSEREELKAYFAQEFDIPDDRVEVMIERAVGMIMEISAFLKE